MIAWQSHKHDYTSLPSPCCSLGSTTKPLYRPVTKTFSLPRAVQHNKDPATYAYSAVNSSVSGLQCNDGAMIPSGLLGLAKIEAVLPVHTSHKRDRPFENFQPLFFHDPSRHCLSSSEDHVDDRGGTHTQESHGNLLQPPASALRFRHPVSDHPLTSQP